VVEYEIWHTMRVERRMADKMGHVRHVSGLEDFFWKGGYSSREAAEMEAERLAQLHRGMFFVRERLPVAEPEPEALPFMEGLEDAEREAG
jgi:hypothetical protein